MKRTIQSILMTALLLVSANALARSTIHQLDVADLFNNPDYAAQLEGVSFYFGNSYHPQTTKIIGERRTNKKTNAFNKTDVEACEWVLLSALLQLHTAATNAGANAVINIKSNYKNNVVESDTQYSCGAGKFVAGVALIGTLAVIQ